MTSFDAPLADTGKSMRSMRGQRTSVRIDAVSYEWKLMAWDDDQDDKGEIEKQASFLLT